MTRISAKVVTKTVIFRYYYIVMNFPLAYIDPGAGALVWQSISAVAIGVAFYFRRIVMKLRRQKKASADAQGSAVDAPVLRAKTAAAGSQRIEM